ncbi:MAG TPA: hypothetical protein VK203_26585 [Nostocaceae cyanobacterium]|nr:hypothetical protein [Nostocaceae cyanobacterium]
MRINPEQIAYQIRKQNQPPEHSILEQLHWLELDEFEIEPLVDHWQELCSLGIYFESPIVQEVINGNVTNLESAILYVLDVASRLGFNDPEHATKTFVLALRKGLKPTKKR